ncbi:MAG TPA: MFS transporter [Methanocorpusculum sp.]|nr:MFS transporter [Methanocorpusculum sp.]
MTEPKKITLRGILVIGAAAIILYGIFAGVRANSSIFAVHMADIAGVSYGSINIVFSLISIILGVSGPVFGYMTIKTSSRTVILLGAALTTAGLAGTALVTSLAGYIIFMGIIFALGASALGYSIIYAAAIPFIGEERGAVFAGILTAAEGVFSMATSPAIEVLVADFGFTQCMGIFSIISLATIPLAFLFKKKSAADTAESKEAKAVSIPGILKEMFKSPFFYIAGITFLVNGICCGCMSNHLFMDCINAGLSTDTATSGIVAYSLGFIIGSLLGGVAVAKSKNKFVLLGATYALWGLCMFSSYVFDKEGGLLPTSFILGCMASAVLPIVTVLIQDRVSILKFAATFTVLDIMYRIGYAFDAMYEGYLFDWLEDFMFADFSISILSLACAVLCIVWGIRRKKSKVS